MIPLSLGEIARLTGGVVDSADPDRVVTGPVVIDSRAAEPGALFVAVRGQRVDGHDFAARAVAAGAVAALTERPVAAPSVVVGGDTRPHTLPPVVTALGRLAEGVYARLPDTTGVAITGSSGKTSTKDLLAQLLTRIGPTVAPIGSHNNEIGHPLTVLRADPGTRHLVLEVSARGPGHIAHLCAIAPPRIGIVLNVGSAHLGEFGSQEAIMRAKSELVHALPPEGTAILNVDDPAVAAMADHTRARVVGYGAGGDLTAEDVELDARSRASFVLRTPVGSAPVSLQVAGAHQVSNALAAAAAAMELGMGLDDVARALSEARPLSRWRMEVHDRPDGVTVINDAYNANPDSVRAALRSLAVMACRERRSVAVLGEMAELGAASSREHRTVGRLAAESGVALLVAVGPGAVPILQGAREAPAFAGRACYAPNARIAAEIVGDYLAPGDVVLVKGSRVAGLERVAEALLAATAGATPTTPEQEGTGAGGPLTSGKGDHA